MAKIKVEENRSVRKGLQYEQNNHLQMGKNAAFMCDKQNIKI